MNSARMAARIIRKIGSVPVALAEIAALAMACAAATVSEARYGPEAARVAFYEAPWFAVLLGAVALTLIAAVLARWPWHWKDGGLIATHLGIVLLLAGALIGKKEEQTLRLHVPFEESQIVFAHADPVVVNRSGSPSGMRLRLDPGGAFVAIERESFNLRAVLNQPLTFRSRTVRIEEYWPDFFMKEGRPATRSGQPNNPAIQVRLSGVDTVDGPRFRAQLLRFDAETFSSTVRFTDSATDETASVSMNHPAHFPPGAWRTALGLNTAVYQSEWNPADLGETTLRAVHNPGWPFQWIGSVILCVGLLFFFK